MRRTRVGNDLSWTSFRMTDSDGDSDDENDNDSYLLSTFYDDKNYNDSFTKHILWCSKLFGSVLVPCSCC